jgi:hypothetical protein
MTSQPSQPSRKDFGRVVASTSQAPQSLLKQPSEGQRAAIALTTLMAGAIGAAYMYFNWDYPRELTIPLHMNPVQSRLVSWAPAWIPTLIMGLIAMAFWRMFVARARGISMKAAVIVFFLVFALYHCIAFICIDYGAALQYPSPPPLWHLIAMFPFELLGGLFTTAVMATIGFDNLIVALLLAIIAGTANAGIGRLIWRLAA